MFLSKLKEFYKSNKKTIFYALIFGFIIFNTGDSAFATCAEGDTACTEAKDSQDKIIKGLDYFLAIVSSLLGTLTGLISLLLNPGWVNGHIFGFDTYLKEIWILISNIVYFIFAFLLIAIAFMNIIGKGTDTWEMRQALPKFVIGVIMVPFSWFFVQFILSISAMLTVAVLGLPYETMNGKAAFTKLGVKEICDTYVLDLNANGNTKTTIGAGTDSAIADECKKNGGDMVPIQSVLKGEQVEGTAGAVYGIINIYTYQIMEIHEVRRLFTKQIKAVDGVKTFASLTIKVIFDLIFIVVFLLLMIALFMALFARGTWLWLYAMFSPVFGLLFFFGKAKEGVGEQKFGIGEFIKLALVPVYVSAALAFGLMFIFVVSNGLEEKKGDTKAIFGTHIIKNQGDSTGKDEAHPSLNVGGFTLVVKGEHGASKGGSSVGTNTESLLEGLQGGLGKIILQLFGLAVLWISVMTALKSSEITGKVIEPIAAFGKSVGSLIQKAPQFAPIIPTGKGMMNASSLKNFGETTVGTINSKMAKPGSELSNKYFGEGTKMQEALRNLDLNKVTAATDDKGRLGKHYLPVLDALNDKDLLRPDFDKAVSSLETGGFLKEENAKQLGKLYNDRKNGDFAKQLYNLLEKKPLSKVDVTSPDMLGNKIGGEQPTVDSKKEDQKGVQNAVFNVILPTTKITKLSKGNLLTGKGTAEYDALYGAIKDEELGKVTKVEFTTSMMKQLDEDDNYNELGQTDREQLVKQVVEQIIDEKRTFKK